MKKGFNLRISFIKVFIILALFLNSSLAFAGIVNEFSYTREDVLVYEVYSTNVGRNFFVEVSIPYSYWFNYYADPYPVVYLVDGYNNFPIFKNTIELLSKDNLIPEAITIGIRYRPDDWEQEVNWRIEDLTPTPIKNESNDSIGGGAENFLKFFFQELKPTVNGMLFTIGPGIENETFAGHSLGGLFGLYTLFIQPDMFDNYLIMSPSIWWDDKVIFEYEEFYRSDYTDMNKTIYLTVGKDEEGTMKKNLKSMFSTLKSRGYENLYLEKNVIKDETHNSSIPIASIKGIRYILGE
jgi:predicted alpha/beta superfamily hydrolase